MNTNTLNRALTLALTLVALTVLPGCANKTPGQPLKVASTQDDTASEYNDPLEGMNRGLFKVHQVIDGVFLKPIAHIYRGLMPQAGQTGVRNVLTNMASPVVFLNSALQADTKNAERTLGRFVINSTVGVAGIFDVATGWGIPKQHKKDFGQTMGVYDTRDIVGFVVDIFSDPFTYILGNTGNYIYEGTYGLVERTDLLPLTDRIERDSLDQYATYRSIYLQHRQKVVSGYLNHDAGIESEK
jgi:phospholipid-binding lipoprotein MlaA